MENTKIRPLNHDCLVKIFQYLPICDRIRLERGNLPSKKNHDPTPELMTPANPQ